MAEPLKTETLRADLDALLHSLDALIRAATDLVAAAERLEHDLKPERLLSLLRDAEAVQAVSAEQEVG
jgi:hypothetical protein